MLQQLYLKNYALFAEARISFEAGLNILTGETGAGKSLLVGALGLINGKRADSSVIFIANEKCVVEAQFASLRPSICRRLEKFEEFDVEGNDLIVRREINPSGKSRAFINDTPVSLQILRQVAALLLDMHGQHENHLLLSTDQQLELVDAFADHADHLFAFGEHVKSSERILREIRQLEEKEKQAREQMEFLNFQIEELETAGVEADEEKQLEQELNLLQNAEEVREALGMATESLYHQDESLYNHLSEILATLQKVSGVSSGISEVVEQLTEAQDTLKEASFSFQNMLETVESDPERLAFIEERLGVYHDLKRKYKVASGEELVAKLATLQSQRQAVDSLEDQVEGLKADLATRQKAMRKLGLQIEQARLAAKPLIEAEVHNLLKEVGFEKARFEVAIERLKHADGSLEIDGERLRPAANGINRGYFLIQTNPGMPAGMLNQIASGGEIARVMLAIKAALAEKSEFPVLIFDEIDTGISGEIAMKVGTVMHRLARRFQILSITHLPQIAAKGDQHFQIIKRIKDEQTQSMVERLNQEGRINVLARMLSGDDPTESALRNAAELIGS
ncbi:MAG: DNA repair protein RecN [Bacteroidota bacterium]